MKVALVLLLAAVSTARQDKPVAKPAAKAAMPAVGMSGPSLQLPKPLPKGEKVAETTLTLDPTGISNEVHKTSLLMRFPSVIQLSDAKPTSVTKEPKYAAKPKYGVISLGTGSKSQVVFVVDEPEDQALIYIDANRDGDLTNDPKVAWSTVKPFMNEQTGDKGTSLTGTFSFPVAWKSGDATYSLDLFRAKGRPTVSSFRNSARTGKLTIGGKTYDIRLAENASNGVFDNLEAAKNRKPGVWLLIDFNGDGTFKLVDGKREVLETTRPLPIGDEFYAAEFTEDGAKLTLYKTEPPPKVVTAPRKPLLKAGEKAPDFTFVLAGGKTAKLSDYRGKLKVLDMWATWCGPCIAAMPKVEALHQQVKGQDVVVLGLCVMDEKESYDRWIDKNLGKTYNFNFGFDPSGANHAAGGISNAWGVYAIPTTFVIDKDDTILTVIQGFSPANHEKVVKALNDKGVKVVVDPAARPKAE